MLKKDSVGFLLLRYTVLYTVESLSLLYHLLYLDLYVLVLGEDALISLRSFMQTKHIYVLIHILTKGEVGAPWNWFKPSSKLFLLTVPRPFFCGSHMLFLSCFCYAFVRVCLLMPCGHLLGKGWPLGSRLWWLIVKLALSHWCSGSCVVLDCIDSWSMPSFLHFLACKLSDVVSFMLINIKMPTTIVGILAFMSLINSMLSWDEHDQSYCGLWSYWVTTYAC